MCGYYNLIEGDDFDWLRERSSSLTTPLSPGIDHTTSTINGYFAYIQPSQTQKPGEKAWLASEILSIDKEACLTLFVYKKGQQVGDLNVYTRTTNKNPVLVKGFPGESAGGNWMLAEVTLPVNTDYFDVLIEAIVGQGGDQQFIAIDDLLLTRDGTCDYFKSTTTTPTTTTKGPSFVYQCSFERDFCDWKVVSLPLGANWMRRNGEFAVYGEAAFNDVTYQNVLGYYAYVDLKATSSGQAILQSPALSFTQESCLELWFQLGGPVNSGLDIYVRDGLNRNMVWKRSGNQADSWSHLYLKIDKSDSVRTIELEADTGAANKGFVAVDEIKLIQGSCPATQYCDFENGICDFEHDITGQFQWIRHRGKTPSGFLQTGPSYDQ